MYTRTGAGWLLTFVLFLEMGKGVQNNKSHSVGHHNKWRGG